MEEIARGTTPNCEECHLMVIDKLDEIVAWINEQQVKKERE